MDYIHTTKAELGINLDIPLSKQDPLDKLNDLANKKIKHADDIHDYFKATKRLKSSDFVTIEDLKDFSNAMLYTVQEIFFRQHQGPGVDDHARTFSSLLLAKVDKRNLNPLKSLEDWEVSSLQCMQRSLNISFTSRRFIRREKDCFMPKGIKQSPLEKVLLKSAEKYICFSSKDCTWLKFKFEGDNTPIVIQPPCYSASKKAWRGKHIVLASSQGCPIESFAQLPFYCFNLKMENEGTVTDIETDDTGRFKMCFIGFGVAIKSFLCYMRSLIIINAAHLKGTYLGTNLVVVGMDGNNQIIPIVAGVSQGETGESWTWFLRKLKECIGVILEDMQSVHACR
ncbi:transposase, MuDR, MULE transposase domain protein [Tanacetum coccineum]